MRGSKQGNQAMTLLNWLFQDEIFFEAILRNVSDIISRRDDRYVALGWCILGRSLIEYENFLSNVMTNGNFIIYFSLFAWLSMYFFSFLIQLPPYGVSILLFYMFSPSL